MKRPRLLVWHGPDDVEAARREAKAHHPSVWTPELCPVIDITTGEEIT